LFFMYDYKIQHAFATDVTCKEESNADVAIEATHG